MAKKMALVCDGVVTNMIWCNDNAKETEIWKDPKERLVLIGDTYSDGKWYRDGVEVLTEQEAELARLRAENADMQAALETIYMGVTE